MKSCYMTLLSCLKTCLVVSFGPFFDYKYSGVNILALSSRPNKIFTSAYTNVVMKLQS